MKIYALKTCDTCRSAQKALIAAGHTFEVIDVRADGIGTDDLAAILGAFGDEALNTRSKTWRDLDEAARALPPAELITAHPTVMKRPVIEHEGQWYLGWKEPQKAALL